MSWQMISTPKPSALAVAWTPLMVMVRLPLCRLCTCAKPGATASLSRAGDAWFHVDSDDVSELIDGRQLDDRLLFVVHKRHHTGTACVDRDRDPVGSDLEPVEQGLALDRGAGAEDQRGSEGPHHRRVIKQNWGLLSEAVIGAPAALIVFQRVF